MTPAEHYTAAETWIDRAESWQFSFEEFQYEAMQAYAAIAQVHAILATDQDPTVSIGRKTLRRKDAR